MNLPILIMDADVYRKVSIHEYQAIVLVNNGYDIADLAAESNIKQFSYISRSTLKNIDISNIDKKLSILIQCKGIGSYKYIIENRDKLCNWTISFPINEKSKVTEVKFLSSLMIPTLVRLNRGKKIDFEGIKELIVYSIYNPAEHAVIEPFRYIYDNLFYNEWINIDKIYHSDNELFLYIDEKKNVATSLNNLRNEKFIEHGNDDFKSIANKIFYENRTLIRNKYFLQKTECSICEEFPICMGKSKKIFGNNCKIFLDEIKDLKNTKNSINRGKYYANNNL